MKKPETKARKKLANMRHRARIKARRPAHKKLLMHPATMFLLLCTGVLLVGSTLQAHADPTDSVSYSVNGKVPAEPLTEPAVMTTPGDGQHFSSSPIDIVGTCPYKSYINIERNDIFAGTALCQPDGTFSLQLGLLEGANKLQAHVFNITDDEGPLSSPIVVYYDIPKPPPTVTTTPSGTPTKAGAKPFVISSEYKYVGYKIGEEINWQLNIAAGSSPYAINIKWGDGNESNYVMKDSGNLTIEHMYDKAGFYQIKINGTDVTGGHGFLQLVALVTKDGRVGATGSISGLNPPNILSGSRANWLVWLWPAYATVLLMVLSYWLGERQEYWKLARAHAKKRR